MTTLNTETRSLVQAHAAQLIATAPALTQDKRAQLAEILTSGGDRR